MQQHVNLTLQIPLARFAALLADPQGITVAPAGESVTATLEEATTLIAPPCMPLNPADLPRRFLDAAGHIVEAGSDAHVITHFPTVGLMFDVREWKRVKSLKEAQAVAAECDLLDRRGEWIIGMDYEVQLIVDREFHEPAVDKESFPRATREGLIYTSRKTAWSSVRVWFVGLNGGGVGCHYGDCEGLAVPVLRVPPSQ